ncbi:hypothetical protein GOBAR_DD20321 [Gossypium barbadense]|nr:hypothetical protein GOBAR_DD20321 [Gossypium barbadense]
MAMKGWAIEQWRGYFRTANSDIFDIIDHAIMVAALDCPKEFRLRRDRIAEKLFTCKLTRCSGSGGSKESKANSSRDDPLMNQIASNYSYGEAEALTDEIEEESMIVGEVFRIKEILHNCQDEPDSVLFESLRKLQLMDLTVDILEATGIGKAVNRVRKHSSKQIRHLAQTLIDVWKALVDEWVSATKAVADPGSSGDFGRNNGRKPSEENRNLSKRKPQTSSEANPALKNDKSQQMKRQEPVTKPNNKPSTTNVGSGKPPKHNIEPKASNESNSLRKPDKMAVPKKPLRSQQDKLKPSDEDAVQQKLEATKRKLQERYQQVENAKRRRTIQVMELHDLPKQGSGHKNPHFKHGNHNRQWANGRR